MPCDDETCVVCLLTELLREYVAVNGIPPEALPELLLESLAVVAGEYGLDVTTTLLEEESSAGTIH